MCIRKCKFVERYFRNIYCPPVYLMYVVIYTEGQPSSVRHHSVHGSSALSPMYLGRCTRRAQAHGQTERQLDQLRSTHGDVSLWMCFHVPAKREKKIIRPEMTCTADCPHWTDGEGEMTSFESFSSSLCGRARPGMERSIACASRRRGSCLFRCPSYG